MGTPHFAEASLTLLFEAGYHIVAVFTQPDKPSGRDQTSVQSAVKIFAEKNTIPVIQPLTLKHEALEQLRSYRPDIVVVAAYGKILPESFLGVPRYGCVNVHASLLPRWRGASPVQNALLSGDTETGITILKMDRGMDTGPILSKRSIPLLPDDTTETLLPKLAQVGGTLLVETLPDWIEGRITPRDQDQTGVTLCQLIEREDGKLFWTESAETLYNRFRALQPWPGVFSFWKRGGSLLRLKLHHLSLHPHTPETPHDLGEVFELGEHVGVQTGNGVLFLHTVQLEGKSALPIADFIRGYPDFVGTRLE